MPLCNEVYQRPLKPPTLARDSVAFTKGKYGGVWGYPNP
jgi:hypothetical protein